MGRTWRADDMPDLSGRVAVVTGANGGIGLETSRGLARQGATVVLACRCEDRGRRAAASIRATVPEARLKVMSLDLASLASIRGFADAFNETGNRLDILINNAGVLLAPYGSTEDGFELHFGVNHLGHFALTGRLIGRLLATRRSRVVTVASLGHSAGRPDFARAMHGGRAAYSAWRAYGRSKLANLLFTYELQRRLEGSETLAVGAHPGGVASDLGRRMGDRRWYRVIRPLFEWLSQSPTEGARSVLRAAIDPVVSGGEYYGPSGWLGMRGAPVEVRSSRLSYDTQIARRLWELSEDLTGVRFLS